MNIKKIAIIGLQYEMNKGDPLVFDCINYLIKRCFTIPTDIVYLDFYAREELPLDTFFDVNSFRESLQNSRSKVSSCLKNNYLGREFIDLYHHIRFQYSKSKKEIEDYFLNNLIDIDLIIFASAGTLKCDYHNDFEPYYSIVISIAEKYNIPCVINSIGVETLYSKTSSKCRRFSKALNNNTVKSISTRDDLKGLCEWVKNSAITTKLLADPGIFSSNVYGITKKQNGDIGIGIILPDRFRNHGFNLDYDQYDSIIFEFINSLQKSGMNWKLYTNGYCADQCYAEFICEKYGINKSERLIPAPKTPRELVSVVSSFDGIFTSRLHSCIIAYSLNIPYIALSWNRKIDLFENVINTSGNTLAVEGLTGQCVYERLLNSLNSSYDNVIREKLESEVICEFNNYEYLIK